ncbi:MAG TPA: hypothetical protein VFQ61_01020 [Polyangiaceae bacterium]|nr:hypothetical protein [Polyangiaceae bacterium]
MKGISSKVLLALAFLASVPVACGDDDDSPMYVPAESGGRSSGGASSGGKGGRSSTDAGAGQGGQSVLQGGESGDTAERGGSAGGGQTSEPTGGTNEAGGTPATGGAGGATQVEGGAPSGGTTSEAGAGGGTGEVSLCDRACNVIMQHPTCQTGEFTMDDCRRSVCVLQEQSTQCRYDLVLKCLGDQEGPGDWSICTSPTASYPVNYSKASGNPCYDEIQAYSDRVLINASCDKYKDL